MGMLYRRGGVWWLKYYRDGRPFRESARTSKESDARRLLRLREGDVERGLPISPKVGRVRFEEAAADVVADYRTNGKRSLRATKGRIANHLTPFFGGRRMATITTSDVWAFIDARQQAGASNATINRDLATLKRTFTLAIQAAKLVARPHIPMLREDNVRTGFFEWEQFVGVRERLPEPLRPIVTFAYITGWRVASEVLPLQWRQIDFAGGVVRLDPGSTKNREGRVFPMTAELRALLESQREQTRVLERSRGLVCPWVFHRDGQRVRCFRKVWETVCAAAGCPGRLVHDFRRTAVRNLVRAGVPERVAMTMTGHKTRSVFERYNIVSAADLVTAAARLDERARLVKSVDSG